MEAQAKRKRIAEHWESYRRDVVPKDASETQLTETKRAFYAGAWGAFMSQLTISTESVNVDHRESKQDDWAEEQMQALQDEMQAFSKKPF